MQNCHGPNLNGSPIITPMPLEPPYPRITIIFVLFFVIRMGMIFFEIIFGDAVNKNVSDPKHETICYLNGIDDIIFGEYVFDNEICDGYSFYCDWNGYDYQSISGMCVHMFDCHFFLSLVLFYFYFFLCVCLFFLVCSLTYYTWRTTT